MHIQLQSMQEYLPLNHFTYTFTWSNDQTRLKPHIMTELSGTKFEKIIHTQIKMNNLL